MMEKKNGHIEHKEHIEERNEHIKDETYARCRCSSPPLARFLVSFVFFVALLLH